ncbi:MerR family transcriptional regulator [Streptomyces solisilvae]|uniref:MerR family transcriptional regulator n=1 Tax=Streptomyces malaysiensis TaxID=92644 RepID=UPI0036C9CAB1
MSAIPHEVAHLAGEDFFSAPVRTGASISPDGTRIAHLAPWRERLNVWVESGDSDEEARCVTTDDNRSVHTYHWTDDPRWLLYEQDGDGDENWHLYRVDLENPDAEAVDLTPFPGAKIIGFEPQVRRPGKAIGSLNRRKLTAFGLFELDTATGDRTMLAENPGQVVGWLCTPDGELYTHTRTVDGDIELARWEAGTGALCPVTTFDGADYPLGVQPFQLTPDGTGAWIGSNRDSDLTRLARLDLVTGEETPVDSHPFFDLDTRSTVSPSLPSPLIRDRRTGELLGVRYLGERQVIHPLDPRFGAVLENLEKLSDGDLSTLSSDVSGQRWVVAFTHDRDPGVTYYYDHSTGESRLLFRPMPRLEPETLAPMTPVTVLVRDGLALPSYLTLPTGAEPAGLPLVPLVPLVHGGPWDRDGWGSTPWCGYWPRSAPYWPKPAPSHLAHERVHPLAFRALITPADTPFTAAQARHPPRRRGRVDKVAFEPRERSMAWSTREIAEIAGTTLRAVRHYHEVGLLEEPERRANGYKQYGVAHLIRVLRIKRLTDLGFSLSQIAAMGDLDDQPEEALRALDTELGATIERLRQARIELGLILRQAATTDLPSEFAQAAAEAQLSDVDRSFIVVMTRILGPQGLRAYSELLRSRPTYPLASKFAALPANADEQTRQDLAERTAPYVRALHAEHPGLRNAHADAPSGAHFAAQTIGKAIEDLYNSAQLDVLRRMQPLLHAAPDPPHPPARRASIDTA